MSSQSNNNNSRINQLKKIWGDDCKIDQTKLSEETLRTPHMHGKYVSLYLSAKKEFRKAKFEYKKMSIIRNKYYDQNLDPEILKKYDWEPWGEVSNQRQRNELLECDVILNTYKEKMEELEDCVEALGMILNIIKDRNWGIKNYIDYQRLQAGGAP